MRICLVSNEILGAHKNGGIGTATSHLAVLLAQAGHAVTLFYVGQSPLVETDRWAAYYAVAKIELCHFPASLARFGPWWIKQPTEVFEQLSHRDFDVILFQEWMAFGHGCIVAKRCGLAFQRTALAVITHSNTDWIYEANRLPLPSHEQLGIAFMEQQAIELADALVSPSAYLAGWMRDAQWTLPRDAAVIPYFLAAPELLGAEAGTDQRRVIEQPRHIAFFGRLEERKGVTIFLQALASEALRGRRFKLTFLGKPGTVSAETVMTFIGEKRPDLLPHAEIKSDLSSDEAQDFLRENECIAVIPSLVDNSPCVVYESLKLGLPFIAAGSGGIPELLSPEDHARCLFEPTATSLAAKLAEVLSAGSWTAARPAYDQKTVATTWLAWFERVHAAALDARSAGAARSPSVGNSSPAVSIVVAHRDRPVHLERVLRSLAAQTEQDFETIVVDDGSRTQAAADYLARAEQGVGGLRVRVIRQDNRQGPAWSTGVGAAGGDRIILLDDDDIAFPNLVETLLRASRCSGADIVTAQMQRFEQTDGPPDPAELIYGERCAFSGGPVALGLFRNCFGDAAAIFRRPVLDLAGLHEQPGGTHADWQLHLRAVLAGARLLSLQIPLLWQRTDPDGKIATTDAYENWRAVASLFEARMDPAIRKLISALGAHAAHVK
ncbi:glycosyltransferase [Chelatococcus reniformis]|uniref:Glycosyltransferase n=1 Tax=Chelatococcus reniformis TaxID=1494448 RepID=A0A916X7C7_9HYPH|nr:glycosyltransferase [Chelatococcus reniformis]GGC50917.1 hypothetical protein GCM10010994_07590 [Chelatococcus reniformis]